jgi:hypothetical protein
MINQIVGTLVGFGVGYGVREIISRRRRAAARQNALMRNEVRRQQDNIEDLKIMAWVGPSSVAASG